MKLRAWKIRLKIFEYMRQKGDGHNIIYSIIIVIKKIMSQFQIHIRHNNGTLQTMSVIPSMKLEQLKQWIGKNLNIERNSFEIYCRGQLLNCNNNSNSIWHAGLTQNCIIDVGEKLDCQKQLNIIVQYGINRINIVIEKDEIVRSVKQKIGTTFDCDPQQFDIVIRDQFIQNDEELLSSYGIKSNELLLVKRKIFFNSLASSLGTKLKVVQSVASGSDNKEQLQNIQKDGQSNQNDGKGQKKINFSSSMRIIKQINSKQKSKMKHSSIEPYTMQKNQKDEIEQRESKRVRIQDIKQTMSFGSLEELKSQQSQVDLQNEQKNMYYRFKCPFGCKIENVKLRLAKAQRQSVDKIQIIGSLDNDLVEQLSQNGEIKCLIYRVIV